jgi:hypothetical protein
VIFFGVRVQLAERLETSLGEAGQKLKIVCKLPVWIFDPCHAQQIRHPATTRDLTIACIPVAYQKAVGGVDIESADRRLQPGGVRLEPVDCGVGCNNDAVCGKPQNAQFLQSWIVGEDCQGASGGSQEIEEAPNTDDAHRLQMTQRALVDPLGDNRLDLLGRDAEAVGRAPVLKVDYVRCFLIRQLLAFPPVDLQDS